MASLQQKRPSISNWFSSLRRPPKDKKGPSLGNSGSFGSKQQLQRSCVDLPSSFVGGGGIPGFNVEGVGFSVDRSSRSNSTFYINPLKASKEDRRRLVETGSSSGGSSSRSSSVCVRCFCNLLSKSEEKTPTPTPTPLPTPPPAKVPPKPPAKPRSPSLAPYTSVATYNITTLTPDSPPPASPTPSSVTVSCSDTSRTVEVKRLPCDEPRTELYSKRSEYTHATTTTITRTLIVSRPVELLLNDKGEIISRRSPRKTRSNSLGCMLDVVDGDGDADAYGGMDNPCLQLDTDTDAPSSVLSSPLTPDAGDMRFIDDSSLSQSESERNSISINNNNNSKEQQNNNNCSSSPRSSQESNLCESCRHLIERNLSNAEKQINSDVVILRQHPKQIKDELCEVVSEMEVLDVPEDCKHSNKDKQMSIGRKKFNMDPKKGIEYLVENRLLRHDPQDVAHFLYKGEGLNKTAIGDYLGEKNDFNEDVLKAFVALHDFTNLILVQALRQFLWSFRLPGEAQKIDRMMECFAQRYCQLNLDIFTNTDTCYVLSFAIIMLNTSLHNPSVKDKPTVEQFISMNRGINNGGDLPRGLLESLYESIRTEPFKIPQDDGNDLMHTFFNPDKEGWLWKQGGRYKSWKRRWFILNDNCLYYFEYTTDKEPRGIIPLENISVREIHDRSKPHCFELFATGGADIIKACKTDSEGKVVEGKHTVYRMSAATEEDQQEWIKRLTQSISHNPFYDILVQRKKKALSKS
ncbi:ankyrin repeat, PH and SEC7 domain containing protein secG isoform X1 [Drosophila persimilis]|uniref:ankyrin repeat, PH and SEC7 domain containing protein secG isoform X1 n=1 Tax=Drosophila persimilis TaxID=7234 RepID=UPI000F0787A0|nr:ankyrin repeat, PH and SEC7 domain containing protein secG isoform X1 [Drosophila persimilis]